MRHPTTSVLLRSWGNDSGVAVGCAGGHPVRWAPDGTPHTADAMEFTAVNGDGVATGTVLLPFTMAGTDSPVRWHPDRGAEPLPGTGEPQWAEPPMWFGSAHDINESGVVVGEVTGADAAWWEPDGTLVPLPFDWTTTGVDDLGRVVGITRIGGTCTGSSIWSAVGARWWDADNGEQALATLGGRCAEALSIQDGVIAGWAQDATGMRRAVLWRPLEVPVTSSTTEAPTTTTAPPVAGPARPIPGEPRYTG